MGRTESGHGDGSSAEEPEFRTVWRENSDCISSSAELGWEGIVVEHHIAQPGEKPLTATKHYFVELATGLSYGERPDRRGRFLPYSKQPGAMSLYTEGILPHLYPSTQTELIACALEPDFVAKIAEELETRSPSAITEKVGFQDEGTAGLIKLLDDESRTGGQLGQLYSEHLVHALTQRLLLRGTATEECLQTSALPRKQLQRVIDKMQAGIRMDIDLHSLAKESGYSKSHFLRMFREATGITPYQYLLRLRLKLAQRMIKEGSSKLVDIALACGFSSHTHMSRMFRQAIGVTPGEYRRSVS